MFGVANKDIQFGRQCSVTFDNYATGETVLINDYSKLFDDNGKRRSMLRISFEYTKSLDENTQWSAGVIKIYGLTRDTFNKLGDYLETEVEVKVGFEYSTVRKLDKLFRSILMDKAYVYENGISVSTFHVQGYFLAATTAMNAATGNATALTVVAPEGARFLDAINEITNNTEFNGFAFSLGQVSGNKNIANYVKSWKFTYGKSYTGTPKEVLSKICKEFGLGYTVNNENTVILFFTESGLERHLAYLESGKAFIPTDSDAGLTSKTANFIDDTSSVYLNGDTGLLGLPTVKTKVITKRYAQAVEASEKVYAQKAITGRVNKKGEAIIDKETGKQKLKIPKTKKIIRRSVEAVCLINTVIEPNVYVTLDLGKENELTGDYRVRTVACNGDTEEGAWSMTLALEGEW